MAKNRKKLPKKGKVFFTLITLLLIVVVIGGSLLQWYRVTWGVSFVEILYTIDSPLVGADTGFLREAVMLFAESAVLLVSLIFVVYEILVAEECNDVIITSHKGTAALHWLLLSMVFISAIVVIKETDETLGISEYMLAKKNPTHIYEDYFVEPSNNVVAASEPRNLLYIILESMETTYASVEDGGAQKDYNYIPRLTKLANDNISFSNNDKLGGFHSNYGATWTMGAIFTAETGIPFAFPVNGNSMDSRQYFAKGVTALGDILEANGYYQEFLCGSDANFAGRKQFFEQHGNYNIFDLYTATEEGYISEEEYVWWGMEDMDLYRVAKNELTRISQIDQPFNFTMLTVDTHHTDGWVCKLCDDKYPEQLGNILDCADRQVDEFIEWCKEQPWFQNTTIVIQGDHPRMDSTLVAETNDYNRTVYNCFINTTYDKDKLYLSNREFVTMDMFPTLLASIGFEIDNNRLGLGTNLFSDEKTLCEEMGYDYENEELPKYSEYYESFY